MPLQQGSRQETQDFRGSNGSGRGYAETSGIACWIGRRTDACRGHRRRDEPRTRETRVGTIKLRICQDCKRTLKTEVFVRYQCSERPLVVSLVELDLESVSTRTVMDVMAALCGTSFSTSTVSRLGGELDVDLAAWRDRRLDDVAYPYLGSMRGTSASTSAGRSPVKGC